jgi:acetyltransferase
VRVAPAESSGSERLAIRPYPRELQQTIRLPSGREVFVRPIRPEDQPAHRTFIHRITPEDFRFRQIGVTRDLPPSEMARLVQIDYDREMAFIATAQNEAGESETLAVVRTVTSPDNTQADFALMVRSDLKRTGLGTALMNKMIGYCRSRGTGELAGRVLADNEAMLQLTKKLGFTARPLPESGRCEVRLRLR